LTYSLFPFLTLPYILAELHRMPPAGSTPKFLRRLSRIAAAKWCRTDRRNIDLPHRVCIQEFQSKKIILSVTVPTHKFKSREIELNRRAYFRVMRFAIPLTRRLPTARQPNTIAFAALEISGLALPPAPNPFRAPNMPGHVKAVAATRKAQNMVERFHRTWDLSSL
jgi:hypothetical protein